MKSWRVKATEGEPTAQFNPRVKKREKKKKRKI
jgi:hypothetical protein